MEKSEVLRWIAINAITLCKRRIVELNERIDYCISKNYNFSPDQKEIEILEEYIIKNHPKPIGNIISVKFMRNLSGVSSLKNLTIGKEYPVLETREFLMNKYFPDKKYIREDFTIINDIGKCVTYRSSDLFDKKKKK